MAQDTKVLKPFAAQKLLLFYTSSSFFDDRPNRTCTPSGLLLLSQTGYQSVHQALSSRSRVCCHGETQSRYDTLTVFYFNHHTSTQPYLLHLCHLTPTKSSSSPSIPSLSLSVTHFTYVVEDLIAARGLPVEFVLLVRQVRSEVELNIEPSRFPSTYHIYPTVFTLHQVNSLRNDA